MRNKNTLWEKHRLYLPAMREKAVHRCRHCRFLVLIQGREETRYGCIACTGTYWKTRKQVPSIIPAREIIRHAGRQGLEECIARGKPEAQSCGKFQPK